MSFFAHRWIAALLIAISAAGCAENPRPQWAERTSAPAQIAAPPSADAARRSNALVLVRCHGEHGNVCYDDAEGKSQFWVESSSIYSAEVRERQQRYNIWIRGLHRVAGLSYFLLEAPLPYQYYRPPERNLSGTSLAMPKSIRESGRLDLDTIAIPLYRSVYRLLNAERTFQSDCERDYPMAACLHARDSFYDPSSRAPNGAGGFEGIDAVFGARLEALQRAFARSRELGNAVQALLRRTGKSPEALVMDGINPEDLADELLHAMDAADSRLAAALEEVDWSAGAYRGRASR